MDAVSMPLVKVGPWGGSGGDPWDDGGTSGIRRITMQADRCIINMRLLYYHKHAGAHGRDRDDLTIQYDDIAYRSNFYGRTMRRKQYDFCVELNFPEEFFTHVSGYYDDDLVNSLYFRTNLNRSFGPYGEERGNKFDCSVDHAGAIVGFYGRSGDLLDAIGLYIAVWNPDRFFDSMRQQGLLAYQTSPSRLLYEAGTGF